MSSDVLCKQFEIGNLVVRGYTLNRGGSVGLELKTVTNIIGDKVYLDNSKVPVKFADRLAIVTPNPLITVPVTCIL